MIGRATALGLIAGATALGLLAAAPEETPDAAPPSSRSLATAGYVPDAACAACHRDLAESYRSVGMSRSFHRPSRERRIEDLENARFYHAPSDRHYEMREEGDRLFLERYRLGPEGEKRDVLEREVDWILGSGSTSRTYIHQTEWGELYQLPLAWYTQSGSWGMSPGYDRPDHKGFSRRVQRDCVFCHNAYPRAPAGSDRYGEPQTFPDELPQGLGCQRCHGPGAEHLRVANDPASTGAELAASIVNPVRLPHELRDDVCMQCHLQPSVALSGVRRFGRGTYSYRPGEPLPDYLVQMDVVENRPRDERFEINHHPYRLRQSRCFLESPPGALSCLTCHDPHHKPRGAQAVAQYRAACLGCHQPESLPETPGHAAGPAGEAESCAGCHMPRRRTEDVVHVVMTDHKIVTRPGGPELVAPLAERDNLIETLVLLEPERAPPTPEAEVYLALARVRSGSRAATDRLEAALERFPVDDPEPYLELAQARIESGRHAAAESVLRALLERTPTEAAAHLQLGVALAGQGRPQDALASFRRAFELTPERPEVRYNLGKLLARLGRPDEARPHLERALELRPLLAPAWLDLGTLHARQGRFEQAVAAYRQALAVDPALTPAQRNLVAALLKLGRPEEARRELRAWAHLDPGAAEPRQWLESLERAAAGRQR